MRTKKMKKFNQTNTFKVKNFEIGKPGTVFIIAEIGINHGGNFENCKKLIIAAAKSGANAVKIQTIDVNESYVKNSASYREFLGKNFDDEELYKLKKISEELGIIFFSTPGDFKSLKRIIKVNLPLVKISSGLATNIPLIQEVARNKLPMIISTGMTYESEIEESIKAASKFGNRGLGILKCTSIYPAPDNSIHLKSMVKLKNKFNLPTGFSDHTIDDLATCTAVGLGASIIEKHFTLDKKLAGADHRISMEPKSFEKMCLKIERVLKLLGSEEIKPNSYEIKVKNKFQRFVVAKKHILKNEKITRDNIVFKRCSPKKIGIKPKDFDKVVGKKIKKNVQADQPIRKSLMIK